MPAVLHVAFKLPLIQTRGPCCDWYISITGGCILLFVFSWFVSPQRTVTHCSQTLKCAQPFLGVLLTQQAAHFPQKVEF